jgi:asparagine synthase (glutamine-hydrolysing)
MFAFVIYDSVSDQLFAARDRFGEKPFFYIKTENSFFFASELGALRELFPAPLNINPDAVVDLMENMYINLHHTIYREVQVFPPAHQLTLSGSVLSWSSYYNFTIRTGPQSSFDKFKSEVKDRLYQIVERQLHADVPVATFLSSGIDSSVITAISKDLKPDILAVTMSTGEAHSDEAGDAMRFAKKLGIRQEVITVNPADLDVLADMLRTMQPLADASLIPTHLVTRSVASHTKVMLSGDAGDEVFGSYNKPNLYLAYGSNPYPFGKNAIRLISGLAGEKSELLLHDKNRFKLGGWMGFYQKTNLSQYFNQVFKKSKPINWVAKTALDLQLAYQSNPEKLSFGVDMLTRLPGDFLLKVDAAAMYSSLEVRVPFLDHDLVDFSFSAPMETLSPHGIDKEVTRSIFKDFCGEDHQGSKKGFSIPYLSYLQDSWGRILERFLKEGLSEEYLGLNTSGLVSILERFRSSPRQHEARILFSVLVLEIWLRVFHLSQSLDLVSLAKEQK